MLEEKAKVLSVEGETAQVYVEPNTSCSGCSAKNGCGTSIIASLFPQRNRIFTVNNPVKAAVGQNVIIGLDENVLQRASFLVYMIPLLGMLGGAVMGSYVADYFSLSGEPTSIVTGLSGMALGFVFIRKILGREKNGERYQARILRIDRETIL